MKLFAKKTKDERVVAETNRIYKVGYLILSFGIVFDLYLQLAGAKDGQFSLRMVEFGVLMLALCGRAGGNGAAGGNEQNFFHPYLSCVFLALLYAVGRGLSSGGPWWEEIAFPKKNEKADATES